MKQIDTFLAIKAYALAKSTEESINSIDLPFKAIVEMDNDNLGFYVVNNKDATDAILKGINAIDNKSLLACMSFSIPDDMESYDEVEQFKKAIRIVKKIWLRSIEL